jgi:outer membrane protein assembly factor BamB
MTSRIGIFFAAGLAAATLPTFASDVVQFLGPQRNNVSNEKNLPTSWDIKTGKNIKWSQPVGSQSYAGPIIKDGIVLVGTNNEGRRNPKLDKDRGVIMAFDEKTGEFLWQITHEKLPETKLHDWPLQGICSTPAIEGDRFYYVSNRAQVVAADLKGFRDGENDGPFKDEADQSEFGGDIIWQLDMMDELGVFPHNLAASSPLLVGDLIYVTTGLGVDEGHANLPAPLAPSFLAINKNTGEVVWEETTPSKSILHGTWSNGSFANIKGRDQVIFPAGNGWVYSLDPKTGKNLWSFDANPKDAVWRLGGSGTRNYIVANGVVYDDKVYIAVGQDPEHGEAPGHAYAIDATLEGDVTEKGRVWHRSGKDMNRTIATMAIKDDIVYSPDLSGFVYAVDSKTGKEFWRYDSFAAIWGSPLIADGKVYQGDEDGDVAILKEGKTLEVIAEINMGSSVYTTPLAHNGTLFILTRNRLYAIENGAQSPPPAPK